MATPRQAASLPKDAKPITTWANRDEAWLDVARGVRSASEELLVERRIRAAKERYRKAAEIALADNNVSDAEVERLRTLASDLGLNDNTVAGIERDVIGDVNEAILTEHEPRVGSEGQEKWPGRLYGRRHRVLSLGVDSGTTNSSMAWYNSELDQAEVIYNFEGEAKTPSLVYFGEDETLVGKSVNDLIEEASTDNEQRREISKRIIRNIKQQLIAPPGWTIPDGRYVRPLEVVTEILKKLKFDAEDGFFQREIERAVISYPAEFDVAKRRIIKEAGHSAGFSEVILLQEPVAAALAYDREGRDVGEHVLVYDLGSGSFGLAVLKRKGQSFEVVVGPKGTDQLGGDYFDLALYHYCDWLAQEQLGRPISLTGV